MNLSHRSVKITRFIMLLVIITMLFAASNINAAAEAGWCQTQVIYDKKLDALGIAAPEACFTYGSCDNSGTRDTWIPDGSEPTKFFRLFFHIFRSDFGTDAAATVNDVANQVTRLNEHFAPYGIQYEYDMQFVNSSTYRYITADAEFNAMKNSFAIKPDSQMNIYVVSVNIGGLVYSYGTFPWDGDALTNTGGIVMNRTQFWPFDGGTLTHEVGHTIGLYHTHRGVDEVGSGCPACRELVGATDRDLTGDLCSDTDPTPTNYSCSPPSGFDPCSGFIWGSTDPQNYMSYAPSSCYTEFSPQQVGRFHCWADDRLSSWMIGFSVAAAPQFGSPPLTADFTLETARTVNSYDWSFGDGGVATIQNPSHTYTDPGYYTVDITIQTTDGPFGGSMAGLVSVYADTLTLADYTMEGDTAFVELSLHNYIPVNTILLPIDYGSGTIDLQYINTFATGSRTVGFNISTQNDWFAARKAVIRIDASNQTPIPPGDGPIATLVFVRNSGSGGGSTDIAIQSYAAGDPTLTSYTNLYTPGIFNGSVSLGCCIGQVGDADNSGGSQPTVGDITAIVNLLFGDGTPLVCYDEADADQSGGGSATASNISVGDITVIIDNLFGTGTPMATCP